MFQYRKRYGLHAICNAGYMVDLDEVSIPQAVWIAWNVANRLASLSKNAFQYRKRYGLHAILGGTY